MDEVRIRLEGGPGYEPGTEITGEASWSLPQSPEKMAIRLFWFTEGKGDRDMSIVDETTLSTPGATGSLPFRFTLPPGPYSFSGKLITLTWAIEAVAEPSGETARTEIVLAPNGRAKVLHAVS